MHWLSETNAACWHQSQQCLCCLGWASMKKSTEKSNDHQPSAPFFLKATWWLAWRLCSQHLQNSIKGTCTQETSVLSGKKRGFVMLCVNCLRVFLNPRTQWKMPRCFPISSAFARSSGCSQSASVWHQSMCWVFTQRSAQVQRISKFNHSAHEIALHRRTILLFSTHHDDISSRNIQNISTYTAVVYPLHNHYIPILYPFCTRYIPII